MEISKYVGNKIKILRESKDMTQDQLAEMLDTTKPNKKTMISAITNYI